MASNINATPIDETYPIAGQDNDTQGFRDNFNYIKTGLVTAASEITALQTNTAGLKVSAVTDGGDFNGQIVSNAVFKENSRLIVNGGGVTQATVELDYRNGDYQVFQLQNNVTFSFNETYFPDGGNLQEFEIELRGDGTQRTVSFSTDGDYALLYESNFPSPLTVQQTDTIHIIKVKFRQRQDGTAFPLPATILLKYEGSYSV